MSYFVFSCKVPKDTPKSEMYEKSLPLTVGVIHIVRVYLPAGSKGLVHGTIYEGLHQLWPTEPGEDFHGDFREIEFKEEYEIAGPEYTLTFRGWNESTKYEHEIICEFGVLPWEVLHPEQQLIESISELSKWLGVPI